MCNVPEGWMPVSVRSIGDFRLPLFDLSSHRSIAAWNKFYRGPRMRDRRGRQLAAERNRGRHERTRPEQRPGIEHGVAADLRAIAHDRAKFPQAGFVSGIGRADHDRLLIE